MRRPPLTTLALGALAAGAIVAAVLVVGGSPATSSARERTVTVARGVVQSTVSGSGNLSPANQLDLDFGASGEITKIYVKEGEHVGEGQLLAKIDDSSAKVDLAQAQADLQSAQDTLDQVQSSSSSSTSSSTATASAASVSRTAMVAAQSSPTAEDTTTPSSESGNGSGSGSGSAGGTGSSGANDSGTASGSGSSGSSGGGSSGDSGSQSTMSEAAAEANVESAQLNVTKAEKALAATTLRAPMTGTIAAINGDVGQTVGGSSSSSSSASSSSSNSSSGSSIAGGLGGTDSSSSSGSSGSSGFITLAQLSRFTMEVSLSESDIESVKDGQPATVTVNAASGEQFAAHVTHIGVLSSSSSGGSSSSAVSYPVTLTLDQTGKHLKAGMSATADIVTDQVSGIAVPSQALTGSTVTVVDKNGTRNTKQVQPGVVGDSTTQIVSGLSIGDTVVVRSATANAGAAGQGANQLNNALGNRTGGGGLGGGRLGGGGFGGGAGGGFGGGPSVGRTP